MFLLKGAQLEARPRQESSESKAFHDAFHAPHAQDMQSNSLYLLACILTSSGVAAAQNRPEKEINGIIIGICVGAGFVAILFGCGVASKSRGRRQIKLMFGGDQLFLPTTDTIRRSCVLRSMLLVLLLRESRGLRMEKSLALGRRGAHQGHRRLATTRSPSRRM